MRWMPMMLASFVLVLSLVPRAASASAIVGLWGFECPAKVLETGLQLIYEERGKIILVGVFNFEPDQLFPEFSKRELQIIDESPSLVRLSSLDHWVEIAIAEDGKSIRFTTLMTTSGYEIIRDGVFARSDIKTAWMPRCDIGDVYDAMNRARRALTGDWYRNCRHGDRAGSYDPDRWVPFPDDRLPVLAGDHDTIRTATAIFLNDEMIMIFLPEYGFVQQKLYPGGLKREEWISVYLNGEYDLHRDEAGRAFIGLSSIPAPDWDQVVMRCAERVF